MEKKDLKELKKIANDIKPQINIGKNKITENLIKSIDEYLDAHELVKIKSLSAIDKEEVKKQAEEIANATESDIIDMKGFTFTLYR